MAPTGYIFYRFPLNTITLKKVERERNSRAVSLQKGTNQPATRMSLNRSQRSCRSTKYATKFRLFSRVRLALGLSVSRSIGLSVYRSIGLSVSRSLGLSVSRPFFAVPCRSIPSAIRSRSRKKAWRLSHLRVRRASTGIDGRGRTKPRVFQEEARSHHSVSPKPRD